MPYGNDVECKNKMETRRKQPKKIYKTSGATHFPLDFVFFIILSHEKATRKLVQILYILLYILYPYPRIYVSVIQVVLLFHIKPKRDGENRRGIKVSLDLN